eukprot:TRINITY_DN6144_c0_g1_i1.p1 TRINITY_DN6144_c0_g1~~TRINITY_DN6144_c0_g1_i1.p1  ORF type:complete len:140 (+),score=23.58 TRINITY_DN6144_c0_g1_i1:28-420(+)
MSNDRRLEGKTVRKISNLWDENKSGDEKSDHQETDREKTYHTETKTPSVKQTKTIQVKDCHEVNKKPVATAGSSAVESISLKTVKPPHPVMRVKPEANSVSRMEKGTAAIYAPKKRKKVRGTTINGVTTK